MREVLIDKVVLNIGAGTEIADVERAATLLSRISGMTAVKTFAKKRIPTWNLRPGLPVGARVTIRGKKAAELLKTLLAAADFAIPKKSFTINGFSFGVKEYVDIQGVKYDPKIGVIGLDVIVALKRRGYRVARRKIKKAKIGTSHKVTAAEAESFAKALGVKEREVE
ncbi:MAG TPA: 50S ribosomal protein L5 [Candidatus Nanoarchaeia archaeon]|nr:50S ribosomal protein L5 [Candidatus Nanoarchaeia archaeon]